MAFSDEARSYAIASWVPLQTLVHGHTSTRRNIWAMAVSAGGQTLRGYAFTPPSQFDPTPVEEAITDFTPTLPPALPLDEPILGPVWEMFQLLPSEDEPEITAALSDILQTWRSGDKPRALEMLLHAQGQLQLPMVVRTARGDIAGSGFHAIQLVRKQLQDAQFAERSLVEVAKRRHPSDHSERSPVLPERLDRLERHESAERSASKLSLPERLDRPMRDRQSSLSSNRSERLHRLPSRQSDRQSDRHEPIRPSLERSERSERSIYSELSERSERSERSDHDDAKAHTTPHNICVSIQELTDHEQYTEWTVETYLCSGGRRLTGTVSASIKAHDNLKAFKAMFEHVVVPAAPLWLVLTITEQTDTGLLPVAVGVVSIGRVAALKSVAADIYFHSVSKSDKKGWGSFAERLISGGASPTPCAALKSISVLAAATAVTPEEFTPQAVGGPGQSYVLDSFNPQERFVLNLRELALNDTSGASNYWVSVSAPHMTVRGAVSLPVKAGQVIGLSVEFSQFKAGDKVTLTLHKSATALIAGSLTLQPDRPGDATVALSSANAGYQGYIKVSSDYYGTTYKVPPPVARLLDSSSHALAGISTLSRESLLPHFAPLLTRTLNMLTVFDGSAAFAALEALAEAAALCKDAYPLDFYLARTMPGRGQMLAQLLDAYAGGLAHASEATHMVMVRLCRWLSPRAGPIEAALGHVTQAYVDLFSSALGSGVGPHLGPGTLGARHLDGLYASVRGIVSDGLLSEQLGLVLTALTDTPSFDGSSERVYLLARIANSWLADTPHMWESMLEWSAGLWQSESVTALRGVAALLNAVCEPDHAPSPRTVAEFTPLVLAALHRVLAKTRVRFSAHMELFPSHPTHDLQDATAAAIELMLVLSKLFAVIPHLEDGPAAASLQDRMSFKLSISSRTQIELCTAAIATSEMLVEAPVFPKTLVSLYCVQIRVAAAILVYVSSLLPPIPPPRRAMDFDSRLYSRFMLASARIAACRQLATSALSHEQAAAVAAITGTTRSRMLSFFHSHWKSLGWLQKEKRLGSTRYGGYQLHLFGGVNSVMPSVIQLGLQAGGDVGMLQTVALVLKDILAGGLSLSGSLNEPQAFTSWLAEIISSADAFFAQTPKPQMPKLADCLLFGDELFRAVDEPIVQEVVAYLEHACEFYASESMFAATNMLRFARRIGHRPLFTRFTALILEAGRDKRMHGLMYLEFAALYEYENHEMLPPTQQPRLPMQRAAERKDKLIEMAIECFMTGREWLLALDAVTMQVQRAADLANFRRRAALLSRQAKICGSISDNPPSQTYFYLVSFVGDQLGVMSCREFIFEASGVRLDEMQAQLQTRYCVSCRGSVNELQQGESAIIVRTVSPFVGGMPRVSTPAYVSHAMEAHQARQFSLSQPLPGATSVSDLWVDETIFTTDQPLPTISSMAQVVHTEKRRLSPATNAKRALAIKTAELRAMLARTAEREPGCDVQLESLLTGVVSAPVNGGVSAYASLLAENEDLQQSFAELRSAIKAALDVYEKIIPPERHSHVENLKSDFERKFGRAARRLSRRPAPV